VRALVRDASRLRELDGVEPVLGDLRDPESLDRAVKGCSVVYHVAADYRLWVSDAEEMFRSNVGGTRSMIDAARRADVERFVYTSTVGCIGMPEGDLGDENSPVSLDQMSGPYKRSKFLAEQAALEYAAGGFPVVVVNPTAPVGDHDIKPTPTGKIVVDFVRGAMPAYLDTGLNVVDVHDVAEGHLLAESRGKAGERYILGARNMTLQEILGSLAQVSGQRAPKMRIPYAVAYMAAAASTGWAHVTGKQPLAPLDGVRMARKKMWVTHDKAVRELGYSPGEPEAALARAVDWFLRNGYC